MERWGWVRVASVCFFFQAEDGIRDVAVTGVQTCALPIFSPGEDVQGGPRLAMVSNHFWQNYLSSDPHAVGNTIQLGGNSYTVIGVMSASLAPPAEHADVFVHSSSATRERALSAICTSAYLLASEGGRYAGAGAGRYGRDRPSARGAVSGRRKRTEEPISAAA